MSYKSSFIKAAIKWTPKIMILTVGNIALKGIAKLTDFKFDLDARTVFVQTLLAGEQEAIEVSVEGFAITKEGESYRFIMQQAQANRPWLQQLLNRIAGKSWEIPAVIELTSYLDFAAELFKDENREQQDDLSTEE